MKRLIGMVLLFLSVAALIGFAQAPVKLLFWTHEDVVHNAVSALVTINMGRH